MSATDPQPPRLGTVAARLGRWRKYAASPVALAAALTAVACGVRSIGLTHSFELWVGGLPLRYAFASFVVVLPVVLAVVWVVRQPLAPDYTHAFPVSLAGRREPPTDRGRRWAHADGTDERVGSLGTGPCYPDQLQRIAQVLARAKRPGCGTVSADPTSVDDSMAASARQLDRGAGQLPPRRRGATVAARERATAVACRNGDGQ